jgi:hypothetical protein
MNLIRRCTSLIMVTCPRQPTMTERNVVQNVVDDFGSEAGFVKKSGSWYLRTNEVIAVTNLQKSQYGRKYFLNQGFWILELGDEKYPKDSKCHIRGRLESFIPAISDELERLLNLDSDFANDARTMELSSILQEYLGPLIRSGSSVEGLRKMFKQNLLVRVGVRESAQQLLVLS